MTLSCIPESICSWDYRIEGATAGYAAVSFNFMSEEGTVSLGSTEYSVCKEGMFQGRWTLNLHGRQVAEAIKQSAFFRSFEVQINGIDLTAEAESPLVRSFGILDGGRTVGSIRPVHPFTRRAEIECSSAVPELAQLFCFWLTALCWRRQHKSS